MHTHLCAVVRRTSQGDSERLLSLLRAIATGLRLTVVSEFVHRWPSQSEGEPWEALTAVLIVGESHIVAQEYPDKGLTEIDLAVASRDPDGDVVRMADAFPPDWKECGLEVARLDVHAEYGTGTKAGI